MTTRYVDLEGHAFNRRANRAARAVKAGNYDCGGDLEMISAVTDLLTDLRHVAERHGVDFESAVAGSAEEYEIQWREDLHWWDAKK